MEQGVRRQGRELALKVLYSLYDHDREIDFILDDFWGSFRFQNDTLGEPIDDLSQKIPSHIKAFAEILVRGVVDHLAEIDAVIDKYSTNWALDRMARVDLSLLRLAAYELLYQPDVPVSVVINEALEIGKRYGTGDTSPFINGILDKISKQRTGKNE
ncbi:MAG: transcription antitermination factor NusB [Desulfuromonas sp.]|nr:MAG: transcription antitermination factor NusB [Desulfuromonas sp.]